MNVFGDALESDQRLVIFHSTSLISCVLLVMTGHEPDKAVWQSDEQE